MPQTRFGVCNLNADASPAAPSCLPVSFNNGAGMTASAGASGSTTQTSDLLTDLMKNVPTCACIHAGVRACGVDTNVSRLASEVPAALTSSKPCKENARGFAGDKKLQARAPHILLIVLNLVMVLQLGPSHVQLCRYCNPGRPVVLAAPSRPSVLHCCKTKSPLQV